MDVTFAEAAGDDDVEANRTLATDRVDIVVDRDNSD
jgi:hypothetical protein